MVGGIFMNMQVVTCPNCNGQVQIDTSREFGFCSYCGTKILFERDAPANATQAFADNRTAALDEITKIMDHFEPVADEFRRVDTINDQIGILSNKKYSGTISAGHISDRTYSNALWRYSRGDRYDDCGCPVICWQRSAEE